MAANGPESSLGGHLGTVLGSFVPNLSGVEDSTLPGMGENRGQQTQPQEVVISMGEDPGNNRPHSASGGGENGAAPPADGEEANHGGILDMRLMRAISDSRLLIFVIILLTKILYDHGLGLLVFVGLTGTFGHHNGTLKRQVSLKDKKRIPMLLLMLAMLFFSSFFVYYVFEEQNLHNCLIFLRPDFETFDLWTILWCAGITDYILKFATIGCKSLVALLPHAIFSPRKKGRTFLTIEQASQLYRTLPPIPLWILYFNQDDGDGFIAGYIFTGAYILYKAYVFYERLQALKDAIKTLFSNVQYGVTPPKDQIGEACPICQDSYTNPIQLHCKHIFCEDCVSLWFDRERTCPMCRAKIADDPTWRDGSTSLFLQVF